MQKYLMGFAISIVLTLSAFAAVTQHLLTGNTLIFVIAGFALIQVYVQLVFFLELDHTEKRGNLGSFIMTVAVVLILVVGSIWIMTNLNYRHVSIPTDQQVIQDEGIQK